MNEDGEKPAFFVSRRGRQVGVHEVDMNGIDIESPAETTQPVKKDLKSPNTERVKKSLVRVERTRSPWSKRKKLTFSAMILSIIFVPLLIAELLTAQYNGGTASAKDGMGKLITSTVLPAQKKSSMSADDIRTVSGKVNEIASQMCRGGLIDNMAKLYPRAKSAHDNCKQTQNKYVSLTTSLYSLETQARYLEKVGTVIKPVSSPITDDFAVIGSQQTMWAKTSDDLKKLNPPNEFKAIHTELLTRVEAVATNWSNLNTANGGQDRVGFEESEKALMVEYEAVRSTSSEFTSILTTSQTKVLNSYNATK